VRDLQRKKLKRRNPKTTESQTPPPTRHRPPWPPATRGREASGEIWRKVQEEDHLGQVATAAKLGGDSYLFGSPHLLFIVSIFYPSLPVPTLYAFNPSCAPAVKHVIGSRDARVQFSGVIIATCLANYPHVVPT
jgi:hypothetical protein